MCDKVKYAHYFSLSKTYLHSKRSAFDIKSIISMKPKNLVDKLIHSFYKERLKKKYSRKIIFMCCNLKFGGGSKTFDENNEAKNYMYKYEKELRTSLIFKIGIYVCITIISN